MELGYEGLSDRMGNRLRADYFTLTIFFRMFIPELFPEYDKVVYIDSDVVVPGDIAELYDTELGTNLIGACRDLSIWGIPEFVRYVEEADGVPIEDYLNSGILVMNAKELRNAHLVERFLELLNKYQFDTIAPDQDYFNVLCNGRITYLDPSWDVMPAEGSEDFPNPNLIHYNLFSKPWCYDNIQYEDYFWPYAEACGFIEEIRAHKANYSDEQKASDSAALGRMLERGLEIIDNEVTFKSVFNTGKEARL